MISEPTPAPVDLEGLLLEKRGDKDHGFLRIMFTNVLGLMLHDPSTIVEAGRQKSELVVQRLST